VDAQALEVAEAGEYAGSAAEAVRNQLGEVPGRVERGRFLVGEVLRERVRFRREDLTRNPVTAERFDLICCRNLLIFLTRVGQSRILQKAVQSLRPGGLLMLGRTESAGSLELGLSPVDPTHRIYRKGR
jgi:two-component system CheB/CheR fusion protein